MSTTETTEAVLKSVYVEASPETAFRVFTDGIHAWWPLGTHGIFGDEAERLGFEEEARLVERAKDGREAEWGKVLAWEPPTRVRLTWRPGFSDDEPDTELEVRFTPEGDGTRVDLEHSGWERLTEGAKSRSNYDSGWIRVLEQYRAAV